MQRAFGAFFTVFYFNFRGYQWPLSGIFSILICRLIPVLLVFLLKGALIGSFVEYGALVVLCYRCLHVREAAIHPAAAIFTLPFLLGVAVTAVISLRQTGVR